MAIEYGFSIGSPATAEQISDVLRYTAAEHGMLTTSEVRFDPPGTRLRSDLLVVSHSSSPPPFPDPVEEEFGFAPTVDVLFRFGWQGKSVEQNPDMIRLVTAVLNTVRGDAWLAFAGEITQLLRLAGNLTISMSDDFWPPELIALLPPHDRAPLPNM